MVEFTQLFLIGHGGQCTGHRRGVGGVQVGKFQMVFHPLQRDRFQIIALFRQQTVEECADKGITGTGRIDDLDLMPFGGDMIVATIQGGAIFSLRVDDTLAAMRKQKRKRLRLVLN